MAAIHESMAAIMLDMDAIGKNQKNQSQGFMYRGIDQVYNALHPVMAKHKVFCTPEVLDKSREERTNKNGTVLAFVTLRVKYTFWAADGSSVSCIVEGEGMDSGDKATNKAMAVAHKYAMLQSFCIPTEDMVDPDSQSHEVAPKKKASQQDLIDAREVLVKCETIEELRETFTGLPEHIREPLKTFAKKLADNKKGAEAA